MPLDAEYRFLLMPHSFINPIRSRSRREKFGSYLVHRLVMDGINIRFPIQKT